MCWVLSRLSSGCLAPVGCLAWWSKCDSGLDFFLGHVASLDLEARNVSHKWHFGQAKPKQVPPTWSVSVSQSKRRLFATVRVYFLFLPANDLNTIRRDLLYAPLGRRELAMLVIRHPNQKNPVLLQGKNGRTTPHLHPRRKPNSSQDCQSR